MEILDFLKSCLLGFGIGALILTAIRAAILLRLRYQEAKRRDYAKREINIGDIYKMSHDPFDGRKIKVLGFKTNSHGKRYVQYEVSWVSEKGYELNYIDSIDDAHFFEMYGDKKQPDAKA